MRVWMALVFLVACSKNYGEENVSACQAFQADCPGIETASQGLYADCDVFAAKDAEENCDYTPFFDCLKTEVDQCDPDNAEPLDPDGAQWLRDMFDTCNHTLPEECPGALGQLIQ